MRCCVCYRPIASGVEAAKMVVEYTQDDGTTKLFGLSTPGGPLSGATGHILRGWHSKCFHVVRKRENRGDAITGRLLAGAPSSYELAGMVLTKEDLDILGLTEEEARERSTLFLTAKMDRLRAVAARVGKAIGDPGVTEAFQAEEHGGPYPHQHSLWPGPYQLREHLRYAHGCDNPSDRNPELTHQRLHVAHQIREQRHDDPGYTEPADSDWRQQLTLELDGGTP